MRSCDRRAQPPSQLCTRLLGHSIRLRFTPELRFAEDVSFAEAEKIETLLKSERVQRDLKTVATPKTAMTRKRKGDAVHGWVVIDKPVGITSTHAVGEVKRAFEAQKAGHAGTLDPMASGVLAVALGEATKTVPFAMDAEKTYLFTARWGEARDSDDAEGEVTGTNPVRPSKRDIEATMPFSWAISSRFRPAFPP